MLSEPTLHPVSIQKKQKPKPSTDSIRIRKETKRRIVSELAALNKKDFGKKILPDHLLSLALSLLREEHREQLRTDSMTNQDRLQAQYKAYCQTHGRVSMDEYLGILLKAST